MLKMKVSNRTKKEDILTYVKELEAQNEAYKEDTFNLKEENKALKLTNQKRRSSLASKEEKLKTANGKVSSFSKVAETLENKRQELTDLLLRSETVSVEKDEEISNLRSELIIRDKELKSKVIDVTLKDVTIVSIIALVSCALLGFTLSVFFISDVNMGLKFAYAWLYSLPVPFVVGYLYNRKWLSLKSNKPQD